ncbi:MULTISPECIES: TetR/AcrR family transcriptional regulator [Microbacterium]|nr:MULTISPECIES: TetR/AcrR family transcriptional regulator [Microbacterium]
MTLGASEQQRMGRPRDPDVERSILNATQELLIDKGYAGMTVADVARAAGSSKAAIYRRWPGKIDLVVAAVRALASRGATPDTGSLRDDLVEVAMHYARADDRSARVLASLLSELGGNTELREAARSAIGSPPVAAIVAVIERWIERGTVPPSVPVSLIAGIVPAVAFGRVSLERRALDPETVEHLVDDVLLPALTRGSRPRP